LAYRLAFEMPISLFRLCRSPDTKKV